MKSNLVIIAGFGFIVIGMIAYRIVLDKVRPDWKKSKT